VGYKLFRAQIAVLINALIWVFILGRGGTLLPSPLRAVGLWVMFSTLNLHRLGAALLRASWAEHRAAGLRRQIVSTTLFAIVLACVGYSLFLNRVHLAEAAGASAFFGAVLNAISAPPASVALYPFRAVIAPVFAASVPEW